MSGGSRDYLLLRWIQLGLPSSLLDRLGELRPSTQIELGQGLTGRIDTLSGGVQLTVWSQRCLRNYKLVSSYL